MCVHCLRGASSPVLGCRAVVSCETWPQRTSLRCLHVPFRTTLRIRLPPSYFAAEARLQPFVPAAYRGDKSGAHTTAKSGVREGCGSCDGMFVEIGTVCTFLRIVLYMAPHKNWLS